ncbi:hypothetical protein SDRG_09835 [Saprolegnia diclina VS20]|uniref:MRH domain-containing protein n=1 Tax=Saprolegnia diclina (strain VS20) TaxID=1156394 RepID=T0Q3X6_SAPDV|nr:hypothetical protein SDRG_09835 [Saprolegnia diclina VS20]EQC32509.1 hypothetical protein SDRG_09835 [Saprolegnia diclina VS20]|eukprot:XP_008614010.1 hypothetical protein SDRG_09835 [Saprolegnia diclina VS20]
MSRLVLVAAVAGATLAAQSGEPTMSYGFSACVNNKRTLYYYTPTALTCPANGSSTPFTLNAPVYDLDCTVSCGRGAVLGANFSGPVPISGCEPCANGTYSLGGGNLYSAATSAWQTPLAPEFFTECLTRDIYSGDWVNNCNPWVADITGAYVHSGNNSDILEQYSATVLYSILRLSLSFVKNGSVTFQYKVDAEAPYDGLLFTMDGETRLSLVSTTGDWVEKTFAVSSGAHTLTWQFTKDYNGDSGKDKAMLRVVEVLGTAYADTTCHPCGGLMTRRSSAQCRVCDVNQYATTTTNGTFACLACPRNTYARAGSIGVGACMTSRPCTLADVAAVYTPCVRNLRNVTRSWAVPMTCNASLPDAIALPASNVNMDCGSCSSGYYTDDTGVCMTCPDGKVIDPNGTLVEVNGSASAINTMCTTCGIGMVAVRSLSFGGATRRLWGAWPSILNNQTAIANGWKLTELGITRDLSPSMQPWTGSYPLDFVTTQVHNGTLSLNYTLSNLPSDPLIGRAWLELFVNRDPTVLSHASVNGSFFVQVPIPLRLDGNSTLVVSVVWRTSNAAVAKVATMTIGAIGISGTATGGAALCDACPLGFGPNANQSFCVPCPSGTYSQVYNNGSVTCQSCPLNTYSNGQATRCLPCGTNTYSTPGSTVCVAPTTLVDTAHNITYNLGNLQRLVVPDNTSDAYITNATVALSTQLSIDPSHSVMLGVFRPVTPQFNKQSTLVVSSVLANSYNQVLVGSPQAYVVGLTITNTNEAGGTFLYNTPSMGLVQCTVPSKYNVVNGGGKMDLSVLPNGGGLRAVYSQGSLCVTDDASAVFYTTTIDYVCSPTASATTTPVLVNSTACSSYATWKSPAACPLCTSTLFTLSRSQCSGGSQVVTSTSAIACVGGESPPATAIQTCSDIVLDKDTAAMAAGVVLLIIVLVVGLLVGLVIIWRRYKHTMQEFLYLKGQMKSGLLDGGSTRSSDGTFEFAPRDNAVGSPPGHLQASHDEENDVEEEIDLGPKPTTTVTM